MCNAHCAFVIRSLDTGFPLERNIVHWAWTREGRRKKGEKCIPFFYVELSLTSLSCISPSFFLSLLQVPHYVSMQQPFSFSLSRLPIVQSERDDSCSILAIFFTPQPPTPLSPPPHPPYIQLPVVRVIGAGCLGWWPVFVACANAALCLKIEIVISIHFKTLLRFVLLPVTTWWNGL